jgi:hypothetical protein
MKFKLDENLPRELANSRTILCASGTSLTLFTAKDWWEPKTPRLPTLLGHRAGF